MTETPFWKKKSLEEMTREEWESLCDGCARCCLFKLEDEDTGDIYYTNVVCRLLDRRNCHCTHYTDRQTLVPTCLVLTPELVHTLRWMPSTCAYRKLLEGKDLEWWHPLVSGDPETVHRARISVRRKTVSEDEIKPDDLEDHVTDLYA